MTIGDSGDREGRSEETRARTEAHLTDFFGRGEAFARQLIAENERLRREIAGEADADAAEVLPASVVEELLTRVDGLERALAAAKAAAAAATREAPEGEAPAAEAAEAAEAAQAAQAEAELRDRLAALEAEKEALAGELSAARAAAQAAQADAAAAEPSIDPAAHAELAARCEALEADKRGLEAALSLATAAAEEARAAASAALATPAVDPASITELEERCVALAREQRGLEETSGRLEAENYQLATLTIAIQQLHSGRTIADVLQTITEVCLNFIGIGCFSVLMVDEPRQVAFPVLREGAHIEELEERSLREDGPLAALVGLGRPWQGGDPIPREYGVLMFLPLTSRERLMGVLCLESFLPQKSELSDDDYAVLAMLSEHAGLALENAWCRAHAPPTPLAAAAVLALISA